GLTPHAEQATGQITHGVNPCTRPSCPLGARLLGVGMRVHAPIQPPPTVAYSGHPRRSSGKEWARLRQRCPGVELSERPQPRRISLHVPWTSKKERAMEMTPHATRVVHPAAEDVRETYLLAPRLGTLQGTTIGLIDNHKRNANVYLEELGRLLQAHY